MPQIRTSLSIGLLCLALTAVLSGCGDVNSQASYDSDSGRHVSGWLPVGHGVAAKADVDPCLACHGGNLDGGISRVSCFGCHPESPFDVHPLLFGELAYARHAPYVAANGTTSCAVAACHGADLLGGAGPSCAVYCHMAVDPVTGQPQKHAWLAGTTAENIQGHKGYFDANPSNYDSCRNHACHGGEGTSLPPPGVFLSGPSCIGIGCHTSGAGNPLPAESP